MTTKPDTGGYEPDEPGQEQPEKPPCAPCAPDPEDCDSKAMAQIRCKANGIEAQAAFNKEHQPQLDKAQEDYNATRGSYRETRAKLAPQVHEVGHHVAHLVDRIRCSIKQEQVVECLDDAFDCVIGLLCECDKPPDPLDCEFDTDCENLTEQELDRRIAEYDAKREAAKARFSALVGEPAALSARVDKVKAEVAAIDAALAEDPAKTDPKQLYAQARVAQYHVKRVWGEFESTTEFVDALCEALTCWTKAVVAISELVRAQAEARCHREAAEKNCQRLRDNTVDEILTLYERLCAKKPCPSDSGNGGYEGGGGEGGGGYGGDGGYREDNGGYGKGGRDGGDTDYGERERAHDEPGYRRRNRDAE
jgi:hypothetical protein